MRGRPRQGQRRLGAVLLLLGCAIAACSEGRSAAPEKRPSEPAAASAPASPAPQGAIEELARIPLAEREAYPSAAVRAQAAAFRGTEREIIQQVFAWLDRHLVPLEQTDRWKQLDEPEERDLARHSLLCARTADEIVRSGYFFGCGEVAMAFIALCKAAGLDARFFHAVSEDWDEEHDAGHAFAEVYLRAEQRWLLVDPTRRVVHEDYKGADRFKTFASFLVVGRRGAGYWDLGIYGYHDLKEARRAAIEAFQAGGADAGAQEVLAGDDVVAICAQADVQIVRERFRILQAFSGDRGVDHFRAEIDSHPLVVALSLEKRGIITELIEAWKDE